MLTNQCAKLKDTIGHLNGQWNLSACKNTDMVDIISELENKNDELQGGLKVSAKRSWPTLKYSLCNLKGMC